MSPIVVHLSWCPIVLSQLPKLRRQTVLRLNTIFKLHCYVGGDGLFVGDDRKIPLFRVFPDLVLNTKP